MASQSSRRKSGSSVSREQVDRLLRDGSVYREPPPPLLHTAADLEKTRILETRIREYVLCADPQDRDFPPKNRHCPGRVYIDDALDEAGHDFRCPECERPVFPFRYRKRRRRELRVKVDREGVLAFVRSRLAELKSKVKEISRGVFRGRYRRPGCDPVHRRLLHGTAIPHPRLGGRASHLLSRREPHGHR